MIKSIKIKIEGKKYNLKAQSYRAMFLFEEVAEKSVAEIKTLQDQVTYIYCILKTSNDDFDLSLEAFIDALEKDDSILSEFYKLAAIKKK